MTGGTVLVERSTSPFKETAFFDRGACRGLDPQVFYPETDEDARTAKSICAGCRVNSVCLEYALVHREREGVWGGATERERRRIIRQRRRTA